jgi:hypothetical protein
MGRCRASSCTSMKTSCGTTELSAISAVWTQTAWPLRTTWLRPCGRWRACSPFLSPSAASICWDKRRTNSVAATWTWRSCWRCTICSAALAAVFQAPTRPCSIHCPCRSAEFNLLASSKLDCILIKETDFLSAAEVGWTLEELVTAFNIRLEVELGEN